MTDQIKEAIKNNTCADDSSNVEIPEHAHMAWGLDNDGYFIQLWAEIDDDDFYLEDGFIGTNKNRVLDKLEKYGLLEFVREIEPDKFNCLCLDLPF